MNVLGVNGFCFDASAALVSDGVPLFYAEEERFNLPTSSAQPKNQTTLSHIFLLCFFCPRSHALSRGFS